MVKTFMDETNTMAQSVAIYIPSVSGNANQLSNTMKNNEIVNDNEDGSNNNQISELPKAGPTGQVTNDEDL